jgi:Rrf2 family protein
MIITTILPEAAFTLSPRFSMLSQTAEYALRTVLYLAAEKQDSLFRVSEIAEDLDVPRNYLSKTLHQLARAGVLTSSRGKHGGFRLTKSPATLTLAEVVAPFDGPTGARICLLGRTACSDSDPCPAHGRWKAVSTEVSTFFRETTVGDLLAGPAARPPRKGRGAR